MAFSQGFIDAALDFKSVMQLKTAKRIVMGNFVAAECSPAQKAEWTAAVAKDIDSHHTFYDLGTATLPIQFPAGGST